MAIKYNGTTAFMKPLGHVMTSMYEFRYLKKMLFCILKTRLLVSYFLIYWIKVQKVHVL